MKITVINFKNICKYIVILLLLCITMLILSKNHEKIDSSKSKIDNTEIFIKCLENELPFLNYKDEMRISKEILSFKILSMQTGILNKETEEKEIENYDIIEPDNETELNEHNNNQIDEIEDNRNQEIKSITILSENNIKDSYTNEINGIKIKNQTDYDIKNIDTNLTYEISSRKVIIYHTHTCESYTPTENFDYKMTDSYRTNDLNYTVSRVGDELTKELEKRSFNVIHNKTYHDYPSYNGSYGRSLNTLQSIFEKNKDAEIIIDLHRDAIGSSTTYAPRVKIGDEICAQIMFVIGTDASGLLHKNWRENLKYAIEVQKKADELYPGLFKPIILRTSRFNQHLTKASSIIEVGATGNTLEECMNSMKYLAEIFSESIK